MLDLVYRSGVPEPWSEGDKIPWHDPDFSKRMLKEHLSQDHDRASRRFEKTDQHVEWIHHQLLSKNPTRVLDLACGPGLYTSRLARLGHECVGIDYSPASIAYAVEQAKEESLRCDYLLHDIRMVEYGVGYGLVMLIFGEFNVFRPAEAKSILQKAHRALAGDGTLLLEPHTFSAVRKMGEQARSWYTAEKGLFSDKPHLCLMESFWDADRRAESTRYFIVDASTGDVTQYSQSVQAYTDAEYCALLAECGFVEVEYFPSLIGVEDESQSGLFAIVAHK